MIIDTIARILAGDLPPHFSFPTGVNLAWDAASSRLTITRENRAPDGDDMRYIVSRIVAAGYLVTHDELFDAEPDAPNSQVGYRLTLSKLPNPPVGGDQLVIF